jgi:hypothetical protein
MKLYSEDSSPFSAPVRVAIYAKGLNIDIEPPTGGLLSARFHAINPVGTIPCLILENGEPLPESAAIMEYLEDKFPETPLLPPEPEAKARVRLLQRIGELQIMTPLVELSRQADPARRDPSVAVWLTRLVRGLSSVQIYVGDKPFENRNYSRPIPRSAGISPAAAGTRRSDGSWPRWRLHGSSESWRENVASRLGDSTAASRASVQRA